MHATLLTCPVPCCSGGLAVVQSTAHAIIAACMQHHFTCPVLATAAVVDLQLCVWTCSCKAHITAMAACLQHHFICPVLAVVDLQCAACTQLNFSVNSTTGSQHWSMTENLGRIEGERNSQIKIHALHSTWFVLTEHQLNSCPFPVKSNSVPCEFTSVCVVERVNTLISQHPKKGTYKLL